MYGELHDKQFIQQLALLLEEPTAPIKKKKKRNDPSKIILCSKYKSWK